MKRQKYIGWIICLFLGAVTSCNYLDVELDNQMTQQEAFSKRETTQRYLAHIYDYLPDCYNWLSDAGSAVPRSDEALFSWYAWVNHLVFNDGTWGPTTSAFNIWKKKYEAINQATIFMDNVDKCTDVTEEVRTRMKAEARFLRAYFYFELVCQYGPVFVWEDQAPNILIHAEDVDRHPLDVNLKFIESEYDKAMKDLPLTITDPMWYGRITKATVMAAKSRLLLYAASPLFNGCDLYKGLKNKDGEYLFPQSADPEKWEKAAQAAKEVIDLNLFTLYEDKTETDPFRKAIKSYQGVTFEEWNNEVIWGVWYTDGQGLNVRCLPPRVVKEGYGGFAPSVKLVDTYPMAKSGRYPVMGYNADGSPVIDPKSGY
ncbi:MAG: RagB/SusD family nutrient uptake outer membrane protein, partial [Proteiniphilum sp.]